ncbi:MAG: lysine--tRNA ligase, partial [Scardovia wiggsiae]|nr:lysine--tRNA ligase [Scardovia wiggsiae]
MDRDMAQKEAAAEEMRNTGDNADTQNTGDSMDQGIRAMETIRHAQMLQEQDEAISGRINSGAALDDAVDISNRKFGPSAHPEQVQMRVAKRALMLKEGIDPYPVRLDITTTIDDIRNKYTGDDGGLTLEKGVQTDDIVGIAGRVMFMRNSGGLCFVQLESGDGSH